MEQYAPPRSVPVAQLDVDARATFIGRTYQHLFGALALFAALEVVFAKVGISERLLSFIAGSQYGFFLLLGGVMIGGWLFNNMAQSATSKGAQYGGLLAYTVLEALLFAPILYYAHNAYPEAGIITKAAGITLLAFAGLTGISFVSRKDFSFLGGLLKWGFLCALILIVASWLIGFHLGTFFIVGMIALSGAAILYDTSRVLHHYPEDRYVGASLSLFASIMLMFWYVLQLVLSFQND